MNASATLPAPPDSDEYSWRPARLEDSDAIHQMLLDIELVDQRGYADTIEDVRRDFDNPECNPSTDTIQAFSRDGKLAAWGWVFSPPATEQEAMVWVSGEVHPAHRRRGLGSAVLNWMIARARKILALQPGEINKVIRTNAPEILHDRFELFKQHGLVPTRSSYRMQRDLSQPIPGWTMPDGVTLSPWKTGLDRETYLAFISSFSDHWGWVPYPEELWRVWLTGHPNFHPENSFQAIVENPAGKEEVVGFCLSHVKESQNQISGQKEGWVQELGVIREWRNKGIATALLCAAMESFKQAGMDYVGLGVDTENVSGALRIYERLGFYPIQRFVMVQMTV